MQLLGGVVRLSNKKSFDKHTRRPRTRRYEGVNDSAESTRIAT